MQKAPAVSILIVDDTPANLLAMEATLEWLGETLVRAYSGREALDLFAVQEFAVILMDVQMPVMDGIETAARIREIEARRPDTRPTPIIFVTAAELSDSHTQRAYAEGAVDFIRKPYTPEILRSKVKIFVELYKNAAQLRSSEEEVRRLNTDLERRVAARTAELNLALQRIEASERRYRTLAETMPQIVWTATPNGAIDYVNSRWTEFTGLPLEQGFDWNWLQSVHSDDSTDVERAWRESIRTGYGFEAQGRLLSKNADSYFWFLARAEPLRSADGTIERWLGTFTDIDAQKRAETILQEANLTLEEARDRALEASQAKSLFLANMSHELRTPLNAIMGYAEIIEDELPDDAGENVRNDVRRIVLAGQHLLALINDVLDLAKIEAGKMELSLNEFPIEPLVQQVVSAVAPIAQRRNNTLEVQCLPDCGHMYADELKVRQILLNLLSNACKFTENGSIRLDASFDGNNGTGWVVLKVSDTGIGISPDQLPKLFQEFSQVDATPTRPYGGTGLGLALSKRFVEMMGGSIQVNSQADHGSTFTVRLPTRVSQ